MNIFEKYSDALLNLDPIKYVGIVTGVRGLLIESHGPPATVGELCQIIVPHGRGVVGAEVVGLQGKTVQLMPYDEMEGIEVGCEIIASGATLSVPTSEKLLGRVLDAMGQPLDGKGEIHSLVEYPIFNSPPDVLRRRKITEKITTGVRAIDALLTVGKGQRMGIFSGSGVGKSTLLGMIARNTSADVNVIALIGERGREVREFLEHDLGEAGLARSVVVVASSNKPPLARIRGAFVATAVAEYFRDQGKDVMLMFDSLTRFARAQREIGLAIGEPPANRGFTPSVFAIMPRLLERSGTSETGTITAFYTVLVEGDDLDEPISDSVRGILDGHLVLVRNLAEKDHYPAIDVLQSISRLSVKIADEQTLEASAYIKKMIAVYTGAQDLIDVGAYVSGSSPDIDEAIEKLPQINDFLTQKVEERSSIEQAEAKACAIAGLREASE